MMVMAHGFNQALHNATDMAQALKKLSVGQMGDYLTPPTFNTSFIGPAGPMLFDQNGDSMASYVYVNLKESQVYQKQQRYTDINSSFFFTSFT